MHTLTLLFFSMIILSATLAAPVAPFKVSVDGALLPVPPNAKNDVANFSAGEKEANFAPVDSSNVYVIDETQFSKVSP